nr:MarR family transcriptional regulator [Propionicimonas sp.]
MSERPRLSRDEEDAWMQLLAIMEYLPTLIEQQLRRDSGLGRFEYAVLLMLSRAHRRTLPMLNLSAVTFGSLSRLSHTVTRLAERDLVTRERMGANRLVTLTDAGREALLLAAPGHVREVRRQVIDHVPSGQAAELAQLLRPIADHLKANAPRC